MNENKQFAFIDTNIPQNIDEEFKKQRKAYLAQRNQRKKQAHFKFRKDFGKSSSSQSEQEQDIKQPLPLRDKLNNDAYNTDSSKNSHQNYQHDFKAQRQRYIAERFTRKQEAIRNKKQAFGSSSSEQKDSVPLHPKLKIIAQSKVPKSLKINLSKEKLLLNYDFLQLDASKSPKNANNEPFSARLRPVQIDKKSTRVRYQVQTPSKKGLNIWVQQYLEIKQNSFELYDRSFPLYDMNKIKLLFTSTQSGCLKIKINCKQQEVYFAVNYKKMSQACLDHYYFIFAKIITLKLQLMGRKINPYSKGKIGLSQQLIKGAQLTGRVRKASFFGSWEQKIGVINNIGLSIFKQGKQRPNLVISYGTVRQLWTRFDFDNQNLIIKFLHNSNKVELSIPLENYLSRQNWLFHIYNLYTK